MTIGTYKKIDQVLEENSGYEDKTEGTSSKELQGGLGTQVKEEAIQGFSKG